MVVHDFDDWMFNVDYTWYHHTFKKTFSVTEPALLAPVGGFGFGLPIWSSIRNKFVYDYDIVGVNIQRPNYFGQRVIFSPFLGLKWLTRKHKFSQDLVQSETGLIDNQHASLQYSSIGPSAGLDGSWLWCWGLRLIGKVDVALMYAYHTKFFQLQTPAVGSTTTTKQHPKHLDLLARGGMGMGWGSYLCCNRYHMDFSASFDWMADVSKLNGGDGIFGNDATMLYGLTIRGQFDF